MGIGYTFPGATSDKLVKQELFIELTQFEDLLVADFEDTYNNLVIKTGFMMAYLFKENIQTNYVIKVSTNN